MKRDRSSGTAVGIVRVSSKKQGDNNSPTVQREGITAYAREAGLHLVDVVVIEESAKQSEARLKFHALIDRLKTQKIRNLIFWVWDRSTRNFTDYEALEDRIRRDEVVLHVAHDRWRLHSGSSEGEWLQAELNTLVAKTYSRQLSRRAREAQDAKARTGWYPCKPQVGYRNQRLAGPNGVVKDRGGIIVLTPEGRALVRRMAELRIAGHSYRCIGKAVRDEGLWEAAGYRSRVVNAGHIERLLKDEFYIGWFTWRGTRYLGKHEPMFTLAEWARLQAAVAPATPGGTSIERRGALVGFMVCGECACRITFDPKTKPSGKVYAYYRCSNGKDVHAKHVHVREEDLLAQFERAIDDVSVPAPLLDELMRALEESHTALKAERRQESVDFKTAIVAVDEHEAKLTDALLANRIDDETFRRQQQRLQSERLVLVDKLAQTHEGLDDRYLHVARTIIELAKSAKSRWNVASPIEKRDLLETLLSNSTLNGVTVGYDFRKPFAVLVEMARHQEERTRRDSNSRPSGSKPDALSS